MNASRISSGRGLSKSLEILIFPFSTPNLRECFLLMNPSFATGFPVLLNDPISKPQRILVRCVPFSGDFLPQSSLSPDRCHRCEGCNSKRLDLGNGHGAGGGETSLERACHGNEFPGHVQYAGDLVEGNARGNPLGCEEGACNESHFVGCEKSDPCKNQSDGSMSIGPPSRSRGVFLRMQDLVSNQRVCIHKRACDCRTEERACKGSQNRASDKQAQRGWIYDGSKPGTTGAQCGCDNQSEKYILANPLETLSADCETSFGQLNQSVFQGGCWWCWR